jgi:hypothetical protein
MSDIEFMDELPPRAGSWDGLTRREVQHFAEQLRQHPGQWAAYPWCPSNDASRALASRISRGKIKSFADGFQAVSRKGTVYVRYEGESNA